jgi:hypothetical protein
MISQLLQEIAGLAADIKRNKAVNVNSQKTRQRAIDLGAAYFRDYRGHLVGVLRDGQALEVFDEDWQQLIRLAHGNNPSPPMTNCFGGSQGLPKRSMSKVIRPFLRHLRLHLPS